MRMIFSASIGKISVSIHFTFYMFARMTNSNVKKTNWRMNNVKWNFNWMATAEAAVKIFDACPTCLLQWQIEFRMDCFLGNYFTSSKHSFARIAQRTSMRAHTKPIHYKVLVQRETWNIAMFNHRPLNECDFFLLSDALIEWHDRIKYRIRFPIQSERCLLNGVFFRLPVMCQQHESKKLITF